MALGLIGKKVGMTRVFSEDGRSVAVTVVHAPANRVAQVKTVENDGYRAMQLIAGQRKPSRVAKPLAGHLKKAGVEAGDVIREFRVGEDDMKKVGDSVGVDIFEAGHKVSVTGVSQGKGFAGAIKRHGFRSQDASHGNSLAHRALGSVGQCQMPGRVFKGKKMPGQMGAVRVTTRNLEVVRVDSEKELLLIKGAVAGSRGNTVVVHRRMEVEKGAGD